MELALNLVWLFLASAMVVIGLSTAPQPGRGRRAQLMALGLLLLLLLPAISMTDDLATLQNPAEVETSLRRSQDWQSGHAPHSAHFALVAPIFAGLQTRLLTVSVAYAPSAPVWPSPALSPIDNRPPPAA